MVSMREAKYNPTEAEQKILDAMPQFTLNYAKQCIPGADIHEVRQFWRDVFPWIKTKGRIDDLEIFGGRMVYFSGFLGEFPKPGTQEREKGQFIESMEPVIFGCMVADFMQYMKEKYGVVPVWRKVKPKP